jgi:hypothetical protein
MELTCTGNPPSDDHLGVRSAKNLHATNTLTCGLLLAAGDVIQQKIEKWQGKARKYDFPRTGECINLPSISFPPPP